MDEETNASLYAGAQSANMRVEIWVKRSPTLPGGRVYPAKDARMSAETFRRSFPEVEHLIPHIDPAFSSSFWRRVMEQS